MKLTNNWKEYGCELLGTFLLVFVGLSAVTFDFGKGLPPTHWIPNVSLRLLITGLVFAGTGSLVAISPLGKLSGGHINPCVTLGFWLRKKMHAFDALCYMIAQFVGGISGSILLGFVWGKYAVDVRYGMTLPSPIFGIWGSFIAEMALTFTLVMTIFLFVSSERLMRHTPFVLWLMVATMVWLEAPISGTSLNPARSMGPALEAGVWRDQWIYFVAPPLGAVAAAYLFHFFADAGRKILTGKIFHSRRYKSLFKNVPDLTTLRDGK